jgi:hypothetical protein
MARRTAFQHHTFTSFPSILPSSLSLSSLIHQASPNVPTVFSLLTSADMQNAFELLDQGIQAMNNSKNASLLLNATESLAVDANPAFFPTGLGALGTVYHLLTHPKIKDWVQLIMLGLLAEMTRRISKNVWIWAKYVLCITSSHQLNDESYDWLMGKLFG